MIHVDEIVRKWKLQFDGRCDHSAEEFLLRVNECRAAYLGTGDHRKEVRRIAVARELDSDGRRHIYGGKNPISNLAFIYTYLCRNFIIFVLNLVCLYIKLPSVALFIKFSKFVTSMFLKFKDIFMYET